MGWSIAPAKLPRSAILNNFVDKIVTAIKKIVEIALVQGADDKLGQVSRRSLTDVTLCEW